MSIFETNSIDSSISSESCSSFEQPVTRKHNLRVPRIPKSASSAQLLSVQSQCIRNNSFSSLTPDTRVEERQIISSYVASNLRRSKSSTTYLKAKLSLCDQNEDTRKHNNSRSSVTSPTINALSSFKHVQEKTSVKENKALSRKSSFSYVPSTEIITPSDESTREAEISLLNNGNINQKKRGSRAHEAHRKTSSKDSDPNARLREHSLTGTARINLRDSAIDLVSDDENSEAYTAISLAGTLQGKNSIKPLKPIHTFVNLRRHNRRFYIVIAVLCAVIIVLGGLAVSLALILFR